MKLRQISVLLENRAGRLAEVTRVLADANVNIRALTLADTSDFGILRMLVDRSDAAVRALSDAGFAVRATEVIAVEVRDRPGGLGTLLALFQGAGLNVEYMYAFLERHKDCAIMVFRFENPDAALRVLEQAGVRVFSAEDISLM